MEPTILVNLIDRVLVWYEAILVRLAVLAFQHGRTLIAIVVTSGSVDGTGFIADLVEVHIFIG
jgi:hypothetical protein